MNSKESRTSATLLRNEYPVTPIGVPVITTQSMPRLTTMLSYHDVCENDEAARSSNILVHFFKMIHDLNPCMKNHIANKVLVS